MNKKELYEKAIEKWENIFIEITTVNIHMIITPCSFCRDSMNNINGECRIAPYICCCKGSQNNLYTKVRDKSAELYRALKELINALKYERDKLEVNRRI